MLNPNPINCFFFRIDKFLEDYTSEGEEILENNNNHNNEIELNNNNILDRFNTENLVCINVIFKCLNVHYI